MRLLALAWMTLACLAACNVEQEGKCFGPGEACGNGLCSQSGYCDDTQQCVSKRAAGAACTEAKQCVSEECSAGTCAVGLAPCLR